MLGCVRACVSVCTPACLCALVCVCMCVRVCACMFACPQKDSGTAVRHSANCRNAEETRAPAGVMRVMRASRRSLVGGSENPLPSHGVRGPGHRAPETVGESECQPSRQWRVYNRTVA